MRFVAFLVKIQDRLTRLRKRCGIFLFLFLILFSESLFAKIEKWDFEDPANYRFDPKKIEMTEGAARLIPVPPYRDQERQDFDAGTYTLNTWAPREGVELLPQTLYEIKGRELPTPLGHREEGITALWHFDEPSGTNLLDAIGRTVAKTSDTEIVSGQTGFAYARQFDGIKSHVFIPHYETFQFGGPFTLELWVRPQRITNTNPQTLVSRWQAVGAQKGFALQISPEGKLDFVVSPDGAINVHHQSRTALAAEVWYHVAAIYSGESLAIHLNGVPDGKPTPFRGPIHQSTNPIYLGALIHNRLDEFYQGVIDEAAFYNRALTETETLTHAGNGRGLVGLWHLNERGGLLSDTSGYGHQAAAHGVYYEAEGKLGTSLHFEGAESYLETPESPAFAFDNRLTLETWIKPARLPGLNQSATLISTSQNGFSMSLAGPDGRLQIHTPGIVPEEITGRLPLMPNIWQHVAVSLGEGTIKLYVNGLLDSAVPYTGYFQNEETGIRMGMDSKDTAGFQGQIDEAAIYRRVKTETEIAASAGLFPSAGIYTSSAKEEAGPSAWRKFSWEEKLPYGRELAETETGLLHLYHFEENDEAQSLHDSKGNNPASLVGSYTVPGIFGQSRWFGLRGTDKAISQKSLPALSTFAITCWFQFFSKVPGPADRLFSVGDGNPTVYRGPDGRLHVAMEGTREIIGERLLYDTRWHHLALTGDGRNLFLYIDGMLDGNSPFISATAEDPLVLGNLKSTDSFQGAIDEWALFNSALSRDGILEHYLRGNLELRFLVRSSDHPDFRDSPWRGLKGASRNAQEVGPDSGGLWHLDERKLPQESAAEIADSTRFANHGTAYGKIETVPFAVFSGGVSFNGAGDYIQIPDSEGLRPPKAFTLSAWIRPQEIQQGEATLIDKRYQKGAPTFSSYALELGQGNRLVFRLGKGSGYETLRTDRDGEIAAGQWNHVAATYSGRDARLYINGILKKITPVKEGIVYDHGPVYIGRYGSSESRYFEGELDEVGIEHRALAEEEIKAQFLRGDLGQMLDHTGEGFKPALEKGRYFQYQAYLFTRFQAAGPSFEEVEVRANDFPTDRPTLMNNHPVSYADISHFRERPGRLHAGAVTYQLSNDGFNWFYHNGRHWVIANDAAESNTAEQIESRIRFFPRELGIGSFYFKAFLHSSTGQEPVELDAVELEYLPNKLTVTSPNGGEAWLIGSAQTLRWNSAGEVLKVNVEYSKDDFERDFHILAQDLPNTGNLDWKVPNDASPRVKVRVLDSLDPRIHDTSDFFLRIVGAFEVISPNWEERWEAGTTQEIKWRTTGTIPEVKLEYSTDEFEKAIFPILDSLKNEGKWSWQIPDHLSSTVKVRVSDLHDPLVYDQSNDTFSIVGRFELVAPQAGAEWVVGSKQEIRWQSIGTIPAVKLEYSTGKKTEWTVIADKAVNQNSFFWQIPDEIDDQAKVQISDISDPKVSTRSQPFRIIGALRLLHPKGGEKWTAGSQRKIAWETIGSISKVDLEYLGVEKGQEKWISIAKSYENTGSFIWEVPEEILGPLTLRISDSKVPSTSSSQSLASQVVPGFTLHSPNGGEALRIGSETEIRWTTRGSAEKVQIEYSKDNFYRDIRPIIFEASNLGVFGWEIPNDPARKVWVRVFDLKHPEAHDISDASFRIFGDFKILFPAGGEKLEVGSQATLQWKTLGKIKKVRLEYSKDNFNKDSHIIAESIPNQGRFTWTIPDDIGSGYLLGISDVLDPEAFRISKEPFSIIGNLRLISPAGGEDFIVGTIVPIVWKASGTIPAVRIDYSEDNFEKSVQTLEQAASHKGEFHWQVPNLIGRQFRIRIWDPSHPESMDQMSKPARIIGGFKLLEPNGGEVFFVGQAYDIKWEASGTMARVRLDFSNDNFNQHVEEITDSYENTGRFSWRVRDIPSGTYRIRISDPRDETAYDISNADLHIRSQFMLLAPNGGEGWPVGKKRKIRWQTTGSVAQVALAYSTDDFISAREIAVSVPNTGSYEWTLPDHVSQNVKVRVSDLRDPEAADSSDSPFRIQGILTMTSPKGGEIWKVGDPRAIQWETKGRVEAVRIQYSRDGFSSEAKTVVESVPNTGSFNWTVPDDISPHTKVRVTDLNDAGTFGVSDSEFQIMAGFQLLSPNSGEVWHATDKREVNWMTIGTVREVDLEYSEDDFKTEPVTIDRGILNNGRYVWDIPRMTGENYRLRVCDAENPEICDRSDQPFSIRSPFEIMSPARMESWPVGSQQEIRWNTYGRVEEVLLEYATQSPYTEWKKLAEELPNQGQFYFRVPDDVSNSVFFRVSDWEDESLRAVASEPVRFIATFKVLQPNGGEKWAPDTGREIKWDTLGTLPKVRIEYSRDDFKNDVRLVESSYENTGSYLWLVPQDLDITMKVRISDPANSEVFDVSDSPFKIMVDFKLLSPHGGEKWAAGTLQKIRWKTWGRVDHVRLEYRKEAEDVKTFPAWLWPVQSSFPSKDSSEWILFADKVPNTGEFDWKIQDAANGEIRLRISDARDPNALAADQTDLPFKVLAAFQIVSPSKGEILFVDSKHQILWETRGRVPSVRLEFATPARASENGKEILFQPIEDFWLNTGSYYWTVPDTISERVWLKISDPREPDAYQITDFPFMIRGRLKLELPQDKNYWPVGTAQTLNWKTIGSIGSVSLAYSNDDGKSWKPIADGLINSGSYGWTIPVDNAPATKIRVTDASNPEVFSENEQPVVLIAQFQFANPRGGETWTVADKQTLRWTTSGRVETVWLDYLSGDSGWNPIAGPVENSGSFEWTIPDQISRSVRVRLRDEANDQASTVSESFAVAGKLELQRPVGGEIFEVGSTASIQWKTTGSIPKVLIEGILGSVSSPNAFIGDPAVGSRLRGNDNSNGVLEPSFFIIADAVSNEGRFDWLVPDKISDSVRLRITDSRDPSITTVSPKPFSIVGKLNLLSPKGGEEWVVATERQIAWSTQGTIPSVQLEYSRDNFYHDVNVIAADVANTGAALWTIPDSISDFVKVRISDMRDSRVTGISESFKVKGALKFFRPEGGEVWRVQEKQVLRWEAAGTIPRIRLEYSRDDFYRDTNIIENSLENQSTAEWQIPDVISNTLKLRVSDANDPTVQVVSGRFEIQGALRLKAPAGGESFSVLSRQKIVWDTIGTVPKVRLEYSRDDFNRDIHLIAGEIENQGVYDWTLPDDIGPGIKVRVANLNNFSVSDVSRGSFEIRGTLSFTMPSEEKRWEVDSEQPITWQSIGTVPFVRLEYSKDNFQKDIHTIAEHLPNKGEFLWKTADDISQRIYLRVSDERDPQVFALSTTPIRIIGKLQLTSPRARAVLRVGKNYPIRWKTTGTIPVVRLEYTAGSSGKDSLEPQAWKLIAGSVENTGQFVWRIPDDISDRVKIRISDVQDPSVYGISRSRFSIVGRLSLLSPQGGERWIVGTRHELLWDSVGTLREVRLEFSRDQFKNDIQPIVESTLNTGRFVWTIPDAISNETRVRIRHAEDPRVWSQSAGPFSVIGNFVFSNPSSPVVWKVDQEQKIEWQTIGTIPAVSLEYSLPSEVGPEQGEKVFRPLRQLPAVFLRRFNPIQANIPNEGIYTWRVPDQIASEVELRISDARDPAVFAILPVPVKIEGALEFSSPAAGERWEVGEEGVLKWKTTGTIPHVTIDYSTDNFQRHKGSIAEMDFNEGFFKWQVPDAIGDINLRVRDLRDPQVLALSSPVQVRGSLQLLTPTGGEIWRVGERREIKWAAAGTIPTVRLEYSLDNFQHDIRIIESPLETSRLQRTAQDPMTYHWEIPDVLSDQVTIRVSDVRDATVASSSPSPFKIKGSFQMVSPQGEEAWVVGSKHLLAWKTVGAIAQVGLQYSRDGFKKDIQTIVPSILNKGEYLWTVADAIYPALWVRVINAQDSETWTTHVKPLAIRGGLRLTSPQGGEAWRVDSEAILEWQTHGTIPEVKIEYFDSETGPEKAATLQDKIPNEDRFVWRIPDHLATAIKVRVLDARNPQVFSEVQSPIQVLGVLKFLSPSRETTWPVGSTQELVWETRGRIPHVNLEYSRDHFKTDIQPLYPLAANAGAAKWLVPDAISRDLQIRISDAVHPQVFALTPNPIRIAGAFHLTSPSGGEKWEAAAQEKILWKTLGTVPEVRLEYSFDKFESHRELITDRIVNRGEYSWSIPDTLAERVWVRVLDFANPESYAVSEAPFRVQGRIKLRTPQGGEVWTIGEEKEISWETTGMIPLVSLEYSTDQFVTQTVIQDRLANKGRFSWRIPDLGLQKIHLRVSDASNVEVFDVPPLPVKIQGKLTFAGPQGGEFWRVSSGHPLLWHTVGTIPLVTLEYSTDNFATAVPIILGLENKNRFMWTVPDLSSDHIQFRIFDIRDQSVAAISKPIRVDGELELLTPSGGEVWRVGETEEIRWKTQGTIPKVRLEISSDNFKEEARLLEPALPNTGVYKIKVPDFVRPSLRIRLSNVQNPNVSDVSQAAFKIAGRLQMKSPRGGEVWTVGSRQTLQWSTQGSIPEVHLEYSPNNFGDAFPVAMNLKNTGGFVWEVPDLTGTELIFRITDANDPSVSETTAYPVAIVGGLILNSPSGGEIWTAQTPHPITWRTVGTVPRVNLEYSADNFRNAFPIGNALLNTGSFLWNVPDLSARDLKIRVSASDNPRVFDILRAGIEIRGELVLTSPVGGEVWLVGNQHPVRWSSTGQIKEVRLEFSLDHFKTVFPVIASTLNRGEFLWTLPDAISKEARIRISDIENPSVFSEMQKTFEIRGALVLMSPVGDETWTVGTRHPISWQSVGSIREVRLEYSTDDFLSDIHIIVPALSNRGVYYWDIPPITAGQARVRVVDTSAPEVFDISHNPFRVAGGIELVFPGLGETFRVGEQIEIRWKSTPNIANVKLEYSTDDFETARSISDFLPNTGKFPWSVANEITDNLKIRVSDANNAMVYSFSKVPSRVHGSLKFLSPQGGEVWTVGSRQQVKWEFSGTIPKVRLEYSWDDFKTVLPLAAVTANTGIFEWTVPDVPTPEVRFRIADAGDPSVHSVTEGKVTIVGYIELLGPPAGARLIVNSEEMIRWRSAGSIPQVDLEYSKDNFNQDIHLIASAAPNVGSYAWRIPYDLSNQIRLRIRSTGDAKIESVSQTPVQIDLHRVRWIIHDAKTEENLSGVALTDSTGRTQSGLNSPVALEYPYGIFTTVWTKTGYSEFRNTWLADSDHTFAVNLEPRSEPLEVVRASFQYDKDKDRVNIQTWYEKEGKIVPAVVQSEVKIYDKRELKKTLLSNQPDPSGYFRMIWDTSLFLGDANYLASVAITTANGRVLTSPISYQINLPVKPKRELVARQPISSVFLKPLGLAGKPKEETPSEEKPAEESGQPEEEQPAVVEDQPVLNILDSSKAEEKTDSKIVKLEPQIESRLTAPDKAAVGETISISYECAPDARPVIDVYDANKKRIISGASLKRSETPERYYYLLPIRGISFIPGKEITVTVIERKKGLYKSAPILIESPSLALGLDKEIGTTSVLEVLRRLDFLIREIKNADEKPIDAFSVLGSLEESLSRLGGVLTQESLDSSVLERLNRLSEELAAFAQMKGYDAGFLIEKSLQPEANLEEVNEAMSRCRDALQMLGRLYYYGINRSTS